MKKREDLWSIVEILSHSRHDWMNKLQLLKGNLALKKYDRAKEIINEIVMEAQHESKLCNLHMPHFAEYILTHNWKSPEFTLEYVVLGEAVPLSKWDKPLTNWVKRLFSFLEGALNPNHEQEMMITIETDRTDGIRFAFQFHGILTVNHEFKSFLEHSKQDAMKIELIHCDHTDLTIYVTVDNKED